MAMGLATIVMVVLLMLMMMAAVQVSYAVVYKVGNSAGWTTLAHIDYTNWSATKNFQLGDTVIFEYNAQFHNVMRVTHVMYKSCNASSPIVTFTTGNDSIKITKYGHHFFFCGVPGHCQAGQKVDINVLRVSAAAAPTPSALAFPILPVAPSSTSTAPLIYVNGAFGMMGLAMVILALSNSA